MFDKSYSGELDVIIDKCMNGRMSCVYLDFNSNRGKVS